MKISEEQLDKGLEEFKRLRLEDEQKSEIKARLMVYTATHSRVPSPYSSWFHFSGKVVIATLAIVFSISLGTAYASQASLPGDLLYAMKTTVTEPVLKLTKRTPEAKEDFDLLLADERIAEVEKLIKKDKLTEDVIDKNFSLFEKHLQEKKKDKKHKREPENPSQPKSISPDIETEPKDVPVEISYDENPDDLSDSDKEVRERKEKYRKLIKSRPELNDFYERKAKSRLEKED